VPSDTVLVIVNFTPTPHKHFRVGVPGPGWYAEKLNSDAEIYDGSGMGNLGGAHAELHLIDAADIGDALADFDRIVRRAGRLAVAGRPARDEEHQPEAARHRPG
jgi:hypothetical protein